MIPWGSKFLLTIWSSLSVLGSIFSIIIFLLVWWRCFMGPSYRCCSWQELAFACFECMTSFFRERSIPTSDMKSARKHGPWFLRIIKFCVSRAAGWTKSYRHASPLHTHNLTSQLQLQYCSINEEGLYGTIISLICKRLHDVQSRGRGKEKTGGE